MQRCCSYPRATEVLRNSWVDDVHDVLLGSFVVHVDLDLASYSRETHLKVKYTAAFLSGHMLPIQIYLIKLNTIIKDFA
jgi:hypothetical protein